MRFMSFKADGAARFGVAVDSGVVDLSETLKGEFATLDAVAFANAWEKAGAAARGRNGGAGSGSTSITARRRRA